MYHVSARGVDEPMINVHYDYDDDYYYYYHLELNCNIRLGDSSVEFVVMVSGTPHPSHVFHDLSPNSTVIKLLVTPLKGRFILFPRICLPKWRQLKCPAFSALR